MPQEPLDYESHTVRCGKCDRAGVVVGVVSANGRLGFAPMRYRKAFVLTGSVDIDAVACRHCGHLELRVAPDKLDQLAAES